MKYLFFTLLGIGMLNPIQNVAYANTESPIGIIVDKQIQTFDQNPILKNDMTFIPIRGVATSIGSEVIWDEATKTVTIKKGDNIIIFSIGSTKGFVNGVEVEMPEAYITENKRTVVPLRFASEQLGLDVTWEATTKVVHITTLKKSEIVETAIEPIVITIDNQIDLVSNIIRNGEKYIGTPYVYGASPTTTTEFDCSSFVQRIFGESGITLPRTSASQSNLGSPIKREDMQKGDLVFFDVNKTGRISHVAIYIDKNTLLHSTTSQGVNYTPFLTYWQTKYVSSSRIILN